MTTPMMKCGHAANATCEGKPCCVICGEHTVDDNPPSLEGRTAKCYCGTSEPSDPSRLAFFEYLPNKPHDKFYCGCDGWN